jgi:hypothetical protein
MRKNIFYVMNGIIAFIFLFCLYSCDDSDSSIKTDKPDEENNDKPDEENNELSYHLPEMDGYDIPIPSKTLIPSYEAVDKTPVLEGSSWRLSRIIKNGKVDSTNPDSDKMYYTVWFYNDNKFLFHSSRNLVYSYYKADEKTNLIRTKRAMYGPRVRKERDLIGVDFWQSIMDADIFELNESELKIFTEKDSYLVLKKISNEQRNITHLDEARWALTEFKDIKTGKQYDIDQGKYNYNEQLLIWFTDEGLFLARSLYNDLNCRYVVDSTTIKLTSPELITEVGEPYLGMKFIEALKENTYEIKDNNLTLSNENFILKFKPENPSTETAL